MPVIIKSESVTLRIGRRDQGGLDGPEVPWWEWKTIHFELERSFDPEGIDHQQKPQQFTVKGMEHRFIVKAGSAYGSGQIEIEIRCDGAKKWTALDSIAWSPDSIVDTQYLPSAYAERIRYFIFCDIARAEAEIIQAYTAACMRVVDTGTRSEFHPDVRARDDIGVALRRLREQFGTATIERRIVAEIRFLGALSADEILANVLEQPGALPAYGEAVIAELARADSADSEGYLLPAKNGKYDLATLPISEVQNRANVKAREDAAVVAKERELMAEAKLATEARKELEAAEGYVPPTDLLPVTWSKGWDGYASASCGTDPFIVNGQINRSSTESGAWSVTKVGPDQVRDIAEDEDAARYALEQRLRAEVARKIAAAVTSVPKPAAEIHLAFTEEGAW